MVRDTRASFHVTIPPASGRYNTRRTSLNSAIEKSGSEYHGETEEDEEEGVEDANMDMDDQDAEGEDDAEAVDETKEIISRNGRRTYQKRSYVESEEEEVIPVLHTPKRSGLAQRKRTVHDSDEEVDLNSQPKTGYSTRSRSRKATSSEGSTAPLLDVKEEQKESRARRLARRNARSRQEEASFELAEDGGVEVEEHEEEDISEGEHTNDSDRPRPSAARARKSSPPQLPMHRTLRVRKKAVNYIIPPPLEAAVLEQQRPRRPKPRRGPGWSATGAEISRYIPLPGEDTDSDAPGRSPRKRAGVGAGAGPSGVAGGLYAAGGVPAQDLGGGPPNFGRVTSAAALADTDPLGVNPNVNFSSVGGLDSHIASLKEMTLLPLLYPEVFQQFGITPPRGVLFHGPPGTGKTLMARALANSCRSEGRSVAFFMRKGADVLSKWVGEAERQLRLLFEEARSAQPSIIFFDEIDGLAPVRSSKQDQIHASIVSTLLALMDGMDGRGQVIVIGATNRPDSIDPALRRPGRFDREFYFPLPSMVARQDILRIHTSSWVGWESAEPDSRGEIMRKQLAKLTKGYGGADLRALCTEAALNAVKRSFPQIYRSEERLQFDGAKIKVEPRDFFMSLKKLIPSSARSASSTAASLPSQLVPLLEPVFNHAKSVLERLIPIQNSLKKDTLEDAEWEWDDLQDDLDGGKSLEREMWMQSVETLRIHRPRVCLCAGLKRVQGSGVSYVGAALLDWLEGFHVQNLDLSGLFNDSTRTTEAAVVQLFVEAKRHQPSVIFIPSLNGWCSAVSETVRTIVKSMLDALAPTDLVLLLAVVEGSFSDLPRDVKGWFGLTRSSNNLVDFSSFAPNSQQRDDFFRELLESIERKPNAWPDGWKKRKRVLEVLPLAPPIAPRPPSEAELAAQYQNDMRTFTQFKASLQPIMAGLKRKHKLFAKKAHEEYGFDPDTGLFNPTVEEVTHVDEIIAIEEEGVQIVADNEPLEYVQRSPIQTAQEEVPNVPPPAIIASPVPRMYNIDLDSINNDIFENKYLTLDEWMDDIEKIKHNAETAYTVKRCEHDRVQRAKWLVEVARSHYWDFQPPFKAELERAAARERHRLEKERKALEEEREKQESVNVYLPGTRRSGRANGLAPEIGIVDVGKLERALKRQRSDELNSGKESASDDDMRSNKRSRVSEEEHHSLDVNGNLSGSPPVPVTTNDPIESTPSSDLRGQSVMMSLSSLLNGTSDVPNQATNSSIDRSPRRSPQPPRSEPIEGNPFLLERGTTTDSSANEPRPRSPLLPAVHSPVNITTVSESLGDQMDVVQPIELLPSRSPTPLPTFNVNEELLNRLREAFTYETEPLHVEELEELRARSLDLIWRHRSAWDRTQLMQELLRLVKDVVSEAMTDEDNMGVVVF